MVIPRIVSKHIIFLGLGTNIGDRLANLRAAVLALPPEVNPLACSQVYETTPWGFSDQPDFLNQVVKAGTDLEPLDLIRFLNTLENELGREPTFKYGPRLIDIDILFYDNLVFKTENLTIPHPRVTERAFVLVPLADLSPHFRHPESNVSIHDLISKLDSTGIRWYARSDCGKIINNLS